MRSLRPTKLRQSRKKVIRASKSDSKPLVEPEKVGKPIDRSNIADALTPVQVEQIFNLRYQGNLKPKEISVRTGINIHQCHNALKNIRADVAAIDLSKRKAIISDCVHNITLNHRAHTSQLIRLYTEAQVEYEATRPVAQQSNGTTGSEADGPPALCGGERVGRGDAGTLAKRHKDARGQLVALGKQVQEANRSYVDILKVMGVPEVPDSIDKESHTPGATKLLSSYTIDSTELDTERLASLKRQVKAMEKEKQDEA